MTAAQQVPNFSKNLRHAPMEKRRPIPDSLGVYSCSGIVDFLSMFSCVISFAAYVLVCEHFKECCQAGSRTIFWCALAIHSAAMLRLKMCLQ